MAHSLWEQLWIKEVTLALRLFKEIDTSVDWKDTEPGIVKWSVHIVEELDMQQTTVLSLKQMLTGGLKVGDLEDNH